MSPTEIQAQALKQNTAWISELKKFLAATLGMTLLTRSKQVESIRDEIWRYVLFSKFALNLPGDLPESLKDVPWAPEACRELVYGICDTLRRTEPHQQIYMDMAEKKANYNFIELGPRGTGKSFAYSEFSPYSTLVSQASTSILFYNMARRKVGLVGSWDTIAFDEVGRIKLKDRDTVEVMKNYMANGRFSRGVEVIANASLAFVGNIDFSVEQLVNSSQFDLFISLPDDFDLAIIDRFYNYMPGWEIPKNSTEYLTSNYGFITDYIAEAFHSLAKQSRYDYVTKNCKFSKSVQGRDEIAAKKTLSALIKLLHPPGEPTREELEEYMAYALEGRRRVKEQLNKRKSDDEYAAINLAYLDSNEEEVTVWCPESRHADATQNPIRRRLPGSEETAVSEDTKATPKTNKAPVEPEKESDSPEPEPAVSELTEQHFTIFYGETGHSFERIFGPYLKGVKQIKVEG